MLDWGAPFFDGAQSLYGTVVTALVMYPLIVALIRLFGKRAVSKMNNFDWIVTVAVGSLVASAIGFESVTILDALLAIAVLLGLQWSLTRLMAVSERAVDIATATPTLLVYEGEVLEDAMRAERIGDEELLAAIRGHGVAAVEDCFAVVLESNAKISVVPRSARGQSVSAMADVPALAALCEGKPTRTPD